MHRSLLVVAILFGSAIGANALAWPDAPDAASYVTGRSLDKAATQQSTTAEGLRALDDAAAAALIGAMRSQFRDRDVEIKLGVVDSTRASLRDIALDGRGLVRLQGGGAWMPIRFQALYDTDTLTVQSPSITFVAQSARKDLAADVAAQLDTLIGRRLAAEFAGQPVAFDSLRAGVVGGDARYAIVQGDGIANFAGEGRSDMVVQGIYDRSARRWLQVGYQLTGEAMPVGPTVAAR